MERHKKQVMGPVNAVPCPWCGQPNDFRSYYEDGLLEAGGPRDPSLADCDHCKHKMEIVALDTRVRVVVRQHHRGG